MSSSNCCFLTCIQISQEAGQVVWYSRLFQNFPQFVVIHIVKDFDIVSKAEIDVFLELSCFFHDPAAVGNLTSGSSAFPKTSLNIWKFTVHVLLKPGLENFEHYFTSLWDECSCVVVWSMLTIKYKNRRPEQRRSLFLPLPKVEWELTVMGVTSYDRMSHVLVKICPASMICGSLGGKGVWGRMDPCICMAESLSCSPETITTLLISYTPIQNKKFFKKIK